MEQDDREDKIGMEPQAIEITAELRQVKTMVDHSYNLVLNVPEFCLPQVQQLLAWLGDEVQLVMVNQTRGVITGKEQDGSRQGRKRKVSEGS